MTKYIFVAKTNSFGIQRVLAINIFRRQNMFFWYIKEFQRQSLFIAKTTFSDEMDFVAKTIFSDETDFVTKTIFSDKNYSSQYIKF